MSLSWNLYKGSRSHVSLLVSSPHRHLTTFTTFTAMSETSSRKRKFSAIADIGDGTQGIVNGLRSRSVYNPVSEKYERRDRIKLLRSYLQKVNRKPVGEPSKYDVEMEEQPADWYVEDIDWDVVPKNYKPGEHVPGCCSTELTNIIESWLDICYPINRDGPDAMEPRMIFAAVFPGGNDFSEIMARIEAIIGGNGTSTRVCDDSEEDLLFDALMADISADGLDPIATPFERQVAKDLLKHIAALQ